MTDSKSFCCTQIMSFETWYTFISQSYFRVHFSRDTKCRITDRSFTKIFFFKTPAWQLIFLHPSNSDIRENCLSYKLEKRSSRALVGDDIWPFYTVFLSVTGSWQLFARQQTFMTTMTSFKRHFRPSSHRVNHDKKQVLKKPAWHWGGL